MRGPWSNAKPEMYVKRLDLSNLLAIAVDALHDCPLRRTAQRLEQVLHMGGTLTIIEDTAKARSGDVPYR